MNKRKDDKTNLILTHVKHETKQLNQTKIKQIN